jgi:hypothetical protein
MSNLSTSSQVNDKQSQRIRKYVAWGATALVAITSISIAIIAILSVQNNPAPKPFKIVSSSRPKIEHNLLVHLAKECGGDFSRLSSAQRKQVNDITRGNGAMVMSMEYKTMTTNPEPRN